MRADQQGHRDGSPEAVEARERAAWGSPVYLRSLIRRIEEAADAMERRGLHDEAERQRACAARIRSMMQEPAA